MKFVPAIGIVVCLLVIAGTGVSGQTQFSVVKIKLQQALEERQIKKAEDILKELQKESLSKNEQGVVLYYRGVINFECYKFVEAAENLNQAWAHLSQSSKESFQLGMILFYLGRVQKDGFYDGPGALNYYTKALTNFLSVNNDTWIAKTHFQMARSYALSDLEQRDYYNTKALNYFRKRQNEYPLEIAECQNLEALRVNQRDGLTPYAISLFNDAIKLSLANPRTNSRVVGKYYDNLGYLQSKSNAKLGLSLLRKGLHYNLSLSEQEYWIASSYTNIATVFAQLMKYDSALVYLHKALYSKQEIYPADHPEVAFAHIHIAELFKTNNQPDSAIKHYEQALRAVIKRRNQFDPYLEAYAYQAAQWMDLLLQKEELADENIVSLYSLVQTLDSLIQLKSNFFEYEASQISYSRDFKDFYLKLVEMSYKLYSLTGKTEYIEKGLSCMEAVRYGALLNNYLISNAAKGQSNQSSEKLHKKLAYQYALLSLAEEKQEFNKIQYVKDSINKLYDLHSSQKKENRAWAQDQFFELKQMQNEIPENSLVLEFQETADAWYVVALTNNARFFNRIDKDSTLAEAIKTFVKINRSSPTLEYHKEDKQKFVQSSVYLYKRLIQPASDLLNDGMFVYIIPDGVLYELPFETLLERSEFGSYADLKYFGRKYAVGKAFSLRMLSTNTQTDISKNEKVLVYASTLDWLGLANARKESQFIESFFPTVQRIDDQCTSDQFVREATAFPLLHVALHGKQDTINQHLSYLLFDKGDTLFAYQLYALTLNAQLVVLSACESGLGKRHYGEGVFSMARAFAASGSNNIYVNMWEAADGSAAELAGKFYEGMAKSGNPIMALQFAKREFLKNKDDLTSHPYFWSGTQVIANGFPKDRVLDWVPIICLLVIILIVTATLLILLLQSRRAQGN